MLAIFVSIFSFLFSVNSLRNVLQVVVASVSCGTVDGADMRIVEAVYPEMGDRMPKLPIIAHHSFSRIEVFVLD